jgi:molybdopterin synthase catalytic subunit
MGWTALLAEGPFDPAAELRALIDSAPGVGGIVSFVGVARPKSGAWGGVEGPLLEHHPRLTLRSLETIAAAALERFDVAHVRVVHRCGEVGAGDSIVFAGAASAHRRAAFEAADYLMDRLKTEAVFWKREDGPSGSRWIEPTEADHAERARWE